MNKKALKLLTESTVRWLLNSIFVWMIATNMAPDDNILVFLSGLTGALVVLTWSLIQKLQMIFVIDEALQLPAKSTFEDLGKVIHY